MQTKKDCGCNKKPTPDLPRMDFPNKKPDFFEPNSPFVDKRVIIENNPDEEDLTQVSVGDNLVLKFKDKEYDPGAYSGMGRVFLRKNIKQNYLTCGLSTENILTQEMFYDEYSQPLNNTIFIVQYDYDLEGKFIVIPRDCILFFIGGSFNNGTIILDNTLILPQVLDYNQHIKCNVKGTWKTGQVLSTCDEIKYFNGTKWLRLGAINASDIQSILLEFENEYKGLISQLTIDLRADIDQAKAELNGTISGIRQLSNGEIINIVSSAGFILRAALEEAEAAIKLQYEAYTNGKISTASANFVMKAEYTQAIADLNLAIQNLQPGPGGSYDLSTDQLYIDLKATVDGVTATLGTISTLLQVDETGKTLLERQVSALLTLTSSLQEGLGQLRAEYDQTKGQVSTNASAIASLKARADSAEATLAAIYTKTEDGGEINWEAFGFESAEDFQNWVIETANAGLISDEDLQVIRNFLNEHGDYLTTQSLLNLIATGDEAAVDLRSAFVKLTQSVIEDPENGPKYITSITSSSSGLETLANSLKSSTALTSTFATQQWITQQDYASKYWVQNQAGFVTDTNLNSAMAQIFANSSSSTGANKAVIDLVANEIGSGIQITADKIDFTGTDIFLNVRDPDNNVVITGNGLVVTNGNTADHSPYILAVTADGSVGEFRVRSTPVVTPGEPQDTADFKVRFSEVSFNVGNINVFAFNELASSIYGSMFMVDRTPGDSYVSFANYTNEFSTDGSGFLANRNINWDASGNLKSESISSYGFTTVIKPGGQNSSVPGPYPGVHKYVKIGNYYLLFINGMLVHCDTTPRTRWSGADLDNQAIQTILEDDGELIEIV